MTITTNWLTQLAASIGQAVNAFGGFIPPKAQPWIALGLATFQSAIAILAHKSTPNGDRIVSSDLGEKIVNKA